MALDVNIEAKLVADINLRHASTDVRRLSASAFFNNRLAAARRRFYGIWFCHARICFSAGTGFVCELKNERWITTPPFPLFGEALHPSIKCNSQNST